VMDRYMSVGPDDEATASTYQRQRARRSSSTTDSSTGEQDDVVKDPHALPSKRSQRQAGQRGKNS
jgi:hypothetical protein